MRGYPSVCLPTYPSIYLFACFCQQANCGTMSLQISPFHTIPSIRPLSLDLKFRSRCHGHQEVNSLDLGPSEICPAVRWPMRFAVAPPPLPRGNAGQRLLRDRHTGQRNENNSTIMTCHIGFCIEISGRLPHYTAWKQGVWKNFESANWSLHGLEYFLPISKR